MSASSKITMDLDHEQLELDESSRSTKEQRTTGTVPHAFIDLTHSPPELSGSHRPIKKQRTTAANPSSFIDLTQESPELAGNPRPGNKRRARDTVPNHNALRDINHDPRPAKKHRNGVPTHTAAESLDYEDTLMSEAQLTATAHASTEFGLFRVRGGDVGPVSNPSIEATAVPVVTATDVEAGPKFVPGPTLDNVTVGILESLATLQHHFRQDIGQPKALKDRSKQMLEQKWTGCIRLMINSLLRGIRCANCGMHHKGEVLFNMVEPWRDGILTVHAENVDQRILDEIEQEAGRIRNEYFLMVWETECGSVRSPMESLKVEGLLKLKGVEGLW